MSLKPTLCALIIIVIGLTVLRSPAQDKPSPTAKPAAVVAAAARAQPKSISDQVQKGLAWLIKKQQPGGGWGQGDESADMGGGTEMRDVANVTDTCMAAMSLIRAGSTPRSGPHAASLNKAVQYVCKEIEKSDNDSIFITDIRNTRVQAKLGVTIDTFSAALLLAEVKNAMPDDASRKRVADALAKTIRKIEKNQQGDGTWAKDGWAASLCQSMASKALNVAAQNGVAVNEAVRENAEKVAQGQFAGGAAGFKSDGDAGVQLYAAGASVGGMRQSDNTNRQLEKDLRDKMNAPATTQPERQAIQVKLKGIEDNRKKLADAEAAVVNRMDDPKFAAGFGSNGGEEFLSHLSIGESLVLRGGDDWSKWDKSMTQNMNRIQNDDGSWSGHHCITGRTFCTSAALLVLMVDRTPAPIAQAIRKQ